jgi:hypothetical protein
VEFVHESLIHTWPLLRRWLDENQDDAVFLEQLRSAARQWDRRGRPNGLLWRGEAMDEAKAWYRRYRGELPAVQRDYLQAVVAQGARAARTRRIVVAGVIALLSLLVASATVALIVIRDAQTRATEQARQVKEQLVRVQAEQARRERAEVVAKQASDEVDVTKDALAQRNAELEQALARAQEARETAEQAERRADEARQRAEANEGTARADGNEDYTDDCVVTTARAQPDFLTPVEIDAQPLVGGKGGLNFAELLVEPSGPPTRKRLYRPGFSVGSHVQLQYWRPLVPQLEILFTNRGTNDELEGRDLGFSDLNYIDLTLLARVELTVKSVTLYGLAGPELSILLTATATDFAGGTRDIKGEATDLDIGALVGAGVAIGPFSWGTVTFEARFDRGFIDVTGANEDFTTKNHTIAFLVGYEYRRDRDGDGIPDDKDRCPHEAEDRDGFEDSDGCPGPDDGSAGVARYP